MPCALSESDVNKKQTVVPETWKLYHVSKWKCQYFSVLNNPEDVAIVSNGRYNNSSQLLVYKETFAGG